MDDTGPGKFAGYYGAKPGEVRNPWGRPKRIAHALMEIEAPVARCLIQGISPIEYMLNIMRDVRADPYVRMEAAKQAAPYIHKKLPISIEGGDPRKPVRVEFHDLKSLGRADLEALQAILAKVGLQETEEPGVLEQVGRAQLMKAVAQQERGNVIDVEPAEDE